MVETGESNYDREQREKPKYRKAISTGSVYTSCVKYAQSRGLWLSGYGYARNYPTNSDNPQVGGFVQTNESWAGHLAYVESVNPDGTITVSETNYAGAYVSTRNLSVGDSRIQGYIN